MPRHARPNPIKIPLPGPFALTTFIRPVEYYTDRTHLAEAFVPALNHEIRQLAAAGCNWIQLDEPATPGYAANDPHTPADIARLFNACIEGVTGVHFSLHICFGSFRKLPYAKKTYARYFPDLLEAKADQFVLEYGTREMAEIEQWMNWAPDRELGAGIIDIRTHYCETPDDVAERVRKCLDHVPADKLFLTTDCGLRYVHRTLARQKINNLVCRCAPGSRDVMTALDSQDPDRYRPWHRRCHGHLLCAGVARARCRRTDHGVRQRAHHGVHHQRFEVAGDRRSHAHPRRQGGRWPRW